MPQNLAADAALRRLQAGNARFASGQLRSVDELASQARRGELVAGQSPIAVVLSCSDSRVPSELVFDCGLGDLFIVRVAGNVVAPSLVGSIEFAVSTFGTALVVVMGHSRCGAVAATLDALDRKDRSPSPNIRDIVERIAPAVAGIAETWDRERTTPEARLRAAVRANTLASAEHLRRSSHILAPMLREGTLRIVAAEYALETGEVDFFEGEPA